MKKEGEDFRLTLVYVYKLVKICILRSIERIFSSLSIGREASDWERQR